MSASLKTAGTWARMVTDNGTVAIPGSPAAGDRMFLFGSWKTYTITVANPSGWTPIGTEFADGAVASGVSTGSVKVMAWYRDWQSGDAAPAIDYSAAPTEGHWVIMLWQKGASDVWDAPLTATGGIAAADPFTVDASSTLNILDGAVVACLIGLRDDSATIARNTDAIDDTGALVTWNGNYVESPAAHFSSSTGQDMSGDLGHRLVTTGASGVTLHADGDPAAAETGAAKFVVIRAAVAAEEHSGTVTATGGGVAVSSGVKQGKMTLTATGGGISSHTSASAHGGTVAGTGGGGASISQATTRAAILTANGGGVGTILPLRGSSSSMSATGGGVAASNGLKQALQALVATASGAALVLGAAAHAGTVLGTGGGEAALTGLSARGATVTATGGGQGAVQALAARFSAQLAGTAGGIAILAQSTARAASVSVTGGGLMTYSYQVGGGGEQHSGSVTATGGGTAVLTGFTSRTATVTASGGGLASVQQQTTRQGVISATGGGVATVAGRGASVAITSLTRSQIGGAIAVSPSPPVGGTITSGIAGAIVRSEVAAQIDSVE